MLARTPALTVETEKPRLIAQNSRPYARTRSLGWSRSATVAWTAGRNRSPIRPTTKAATQIVSIERAEPSRISAAAVPKKPISIVRRRPARSESQPPTNWETTEPAPTAAATAPAVPADKWRSWVRYSTRKGCTKLPSRFTNWQTQRAQKALGRGGASVRAFMAPLSSPRGRLSNIRRRTNRRSQRCRGVTVLG